MMRAAAIIWCSMVPGLQVYLFRRLFPDLIKNHMEGPKGFRTLLAPWVSAGFVSIVEDEIRFWNGSRIFLCHCKDEKDRYKYQGAEIHVLLIDELTHFTEVIYRFLRTRVRAVGLAIPDAYRDAFPRILCSSNPGNVGHAWVKAAFVDAGAYLERRMPDEEGGMLRQYIPSRLDDNPSMAEDDPSYRARLRGAGSASLVKALEDGDWNVIEGAFFDRWRQDRHVVEPFEIPDHWIKARSFDWGYAAPFSVGWWAVASEATRLSNELWLPRGGLVRFAEWYGATSPNVGMKLQAKQIAEGILYLERGMGIEKIDLSVADTAIFAEAGAGLGYKGPTIAEQMAQEGVHFQPSDKRRMQGWDQIRGRLIGDGDGNPMLVVTTKCRDFIRTLPVLQHDKLKPEDLDTDGEDHCFTGDTLVSTPNGVYSIADLVGTTGYVWSGDGRLHGYRSPRRTRASARVVKLTFSDGTIIRCTPDHRFLTTTGWVEARSLSSLSLLPFRSSSGSATTSAVGTFSARASDCIARCGSIIAGQFRRVMMSTTGTTIEAGTRSATCSVSPKAPTRDCTAWNGRTSLGGLSNAPGWRQPSGMEATPAGNGIANSIGSIVRRLCLLMLTGRAGIAARSSSVSGRVSSVPTTASLLFGGPVAWTMKDAAAGFVGLPSWLTGTPRSKRARESAGPLPAQGLERVCLNVEPDGRADVYCLTVPDTGNFVLANGAIVSNCADESRYLCMARPWTAKTPQDPSDLKGWQEMTLNQLFEDREQERRWR